MDLGMKIQHKKIFDSELQNLESNPLNKPHTRDDAPLSIRNSQNCKMLDDLTQKMQNLFCAVFTCHFMEKSELTILDLVERNKAHAICSDYLEEKLSYIDESYGKRCMRCKTCKTYGERLINVINNIMIESLRLIEQSPQNCNCVGVIVKAMPDTLRVQKAEALNSYGVARDVEKHLQDVHAILRQCCDVIVQHQAQDRTEPPPNPPGRDPD